MGILRDLFVFIFGSSQRSSYWDEHPAGISLSNNWLIVRDEKFQGYYSISPDNRLVVAYCDASTSGQGGLRFDGCGRVLLVEKNPLRIICRVSVVERPIGASVACSGRFAVNDGCFGFAAQGLARVFDASGFEVFQRRYLSSVGLIKISACGRYLLIKTHISKLKVDSDRLDVIDVNRKTVVLTKQPSFDAVVDYELQVDSDGEFIGIEFLLTNAEKIFVSWRDGMLDEGLYLEARNRIKTEFLAKMKRDKKAGKK